MGIFWKAGGAFTGEENPVDIIIREIVSKLVMFKADGFEKEGSWYVGCSVLDD